MRGTQKERSTEKKLEGGRHVKGRLVVVCLIAAKEILG